MDKAVLQTDIAIIGGGIAGLWALNQLRNRGYSALLFEREALGSYQTIGSQGMIHGGLKYALGGVLGRASREIAAMPDIWRACLAGAGKVDLSDCKVLSTEFYLWSSSQPSSRLSTFLASKLLRGRVEKLSRPDFPLALQDPMFRGQVYRLADLVVDVPSLLQTLAEQQRQAIFRIDWQCASLQQDAGRVTMELPGCSLEPQRLLLMAGAGNASLIEQLGVATPATQRRPLQQVLVRHQCEDELFGHCLGSGSTPRLSISSHRTRTGAPVWYLGGDLATSGASLSSAHLIDKAQSELRDLLPWIDLGKAEWRTVKLDRAEPAQANRLRPDNACCRRVGNLDNVIAAWPTKLTLAPELADRIEELLRTDHIVPRHQPDLAALEDLGHPDIADTYWDTLFP